MKLIFFILVAVHICCSYHHMRSLYWQKNTHESPYDIVSREHLGFIQITLIPAFIKDYTHYKVWHEITYPFPNFNGCTVVHFTGLVIKVSSSYNKMGARDTTLDVVDLVWYNWKGHICAHFISCHGIKRTQPCAIFHHEKQNITWCIRDIKVTRSGGVRFDSKYTKMHLTLFRCKCKVTFLA